VKRPLALVTGGAGGIGRGICARLAADGATVVLADLDPAATEDAARELGVHPLVLDVADPVSRRAAIARCDALGGVDVLVNCAGVLRDARIRTLDPAAFRRLTEINLLGPLALTRLAAAGMAQRGRGSVVNLASRAWLGTFGSTAYSTAKGGLVGATRSLALELGRAGITVNAIAPGFVLTDMAAAGRTEADFAAIAARTMVRRVGRPEDIAHAVSFLVSTESGFLTAQVLTVDGGRIDYIGHP